MRPGPNWAWASTNPAQTIFDPQQGEGERGLLMNDDENNKIVSRSVTLPSHKIHT